MRRDRNNSLKFAFGCSNRGLEVFRMKIIVFSVYKRVFFAVKIIYRYFVIIVCFEYKTYHNWVNNIELLIRSRWCSEKRVTVYDRIAIILAVTYNDWQVKIQKKKMFIEMYVYDLIIKTKLNRNKKNIYRLYQKGWTYKYKKKQKKCILVERLTNIMKVIYNG